MNLKYKLIENLLTSKKEDYTARPVDVNSHDLDSVISEMLKKGSTVTKADILAVLTNLSTLSLVSEKAGLAFLQCSFKQTHTSSHVNPTSQIKREIVLRPVKTNVLCHRAI